MNDTTQQFGDKLKESSLNYAGMGYLLGDAALFAHGMINKDYAGAFTGLSWGVGGLTTALYGKETPEHQLTRISDNLGAYLKKNGIEIPQDSRLQQDFLGRHTSTWNKVENFLYANPSQILNGTYAIGAASLIKSGLAPSAKAITQGKTRDPWAAASGMLVGTGALLGLMLPEEVARSDEEQRYFDQRPEVKLSDDPIGWLNEKPLRWPSLFYTANNVTLFKSALQEQRQAANNSFMLKYLAVATYVVSNGLLGLSSKDHATQSGSQVPVEVLEDLSAQIIAQQPEATKNALIYHVAGHLASQPEVDITAEQLAADITKRIEQSAKQTTRIADAQWHGTLTAPEQQPTL